MPKPQTCRNFTPIGKNKFAEEAFIKGNNTPMFFLSQALALALVLTLTPA